VNCKFVVAVAIGAKPDLDAGPDSHLLAEIRLKPEQTKGGRGRTVLVNSQLKAEIANFLRSFKRSPGEGLALIASKSGRHFSANGLCHRFLELYDEVGVELH